MEIKTERETLPYVRLVLSFLSIVAIYVLLSFGLSYWLYGELWSGHGVVRWINLLILPLVATFVLSRTTRKARIYFTHLTNKDFIQQRLTEVLRSEGYRISEALPYQVYFKPRFALWSTLTASPSTWMEFEEDYILIHGSWSQILRLEKLAYEGAVFLPK